MIPGFWSELLGIWQCHLPRWKGDRMTRIAAGESRGPV